MQLSPARLALAAATLFLSACLFQTERPTGPAPGGVHGEGQAELRLKTGPVGALAKSAATPASAQTIELAALYLTLTADAEVPRMDTIPLSGNGANTVSRSYSGLAAGKTWSIQAHTRDTRGQTIHTGNSTFTVQPGRTAEVSLDLPAYYSMLSARFFPIDDSVTGCRLTVDGWTAVDTVFPKQSLVGDTVRLDYDYLSVGQRRVALSVFGEYDGNAMLLYSGDTLINVLAGQDAGYDIRLVWRGPGVFKGTAAMSVTLGAAGRVAVNGRLLTSKNQDPVFLSRPEDMEGAGAPGVAYADTVRAQDPDGDSVGFSLLSGPSGMVLADSVLSWTPDSGDANAIVSVVARDGKGGLDTLTWNITLYPSILGGFIASDIVLARADSPYWVTGNVLVREGATMTIEPGVTVVLGEGRGIQINGTLLARGTAADSITFTSVRPATAAWARILFADSSQDATYDSAGTYLGGSILEFCRILHGGQGVSGALQMENASPFVHRSLIAHSRSRGIAALGFPTLARNVIRRNAGGGIGYTASQKTMGPSPRGRILENLIDSNATSGWVNGAGIYIQNAVETIGNTIFRNGNLEQGEGGGISISCCGGFQRGIVAGNRIEGNVSRAYGAGFFQGDTLRDNVILGNASRYYSVLGMNGSQATGNRIEGNLLDKHSWDTSPYTVVAAGNSTFRGNTLVGNRNPGPRGNVVQVYGTSGTVSANNFLNPETAFELANSNSSTSPNVNVAGNWWGTADEGEVQERIFDWFDDASLGIAAYSPFLSAPAEEAPVP